MKSEILMHDGLSRIDKLFLDQKTLEPKDSLHRRRQRGLQLHAGDDIKASYGLQLALLTTVNLGVRCFAGEVVIVASADVWLAPCLVPVVRSTTIGDAIIELGGKTALWNGVIPCNRYLILGNAEYNEQAVRITYDGWRVTVGPANQISRLAESPYCPLASIAAAAIAVGEIFAEFAGISITATRRVVTFSLWRPDLPAEHPDAIGEPLAELPCNIGVFGLGHLGQAYLWALAALPYRSPKETTILLCDDDLIEIPNVETGALINDAAVGRLKTRVIAEWLESRGFSTRLLERRVDDNFRCTAKDPHIALSGFDDNRPRQWLSNAGFKAIFDSGLGGEANNFDTIAFHSWPNPRVASMVWPMESAEELAKRDLRKLKQITDNPAYRTLGADECGRLLVTGKSVAVPFVGATAASIVLSEMLKLINGGPTFSDMKLRLCSGAGKFEGLKSRNAPSAIRGLVTQLAKSLNL
ncbi:MULTISPECIES: ThiF family adenylyltransferase [Methylomonas]|uniref:Uncharacterized protein n=2 Tax=Methylomonas TaxID=416 RepID=A0A126T340_9GAMM|nr:MULTISPECIES: ThiF family adenylyltransferase [Methylomonas]AMK76511.1 hypothetical protein JT25_008395 [Methylomonas denitrificans]OAH98768.1 hypothetical protein A1342_13135 [Methylomonas methanica]